MRNSNHKSIIKAAYLYPTCIQIYFIPLKIIIIEEFVHVTTFNEKK